MYENMEDSTIEKIKEKIDIVDLVGGYIKLQKAGINYKALCPFHSEKTGSFFVFPSRQNWHCFGCSEGSSIFDFVMKIEGIEFIDALKILAKKAGVEIKRQDPKITTERQRLYEICEIACCFFEKQLQAAKKGQEVEIYLNKRGLSKESIRKWRLGYAPDKWQALSDFLVSQGYNREEIANAGLAVKALDNKQQTMNSGHYDRFRARIMFPIFDLNSQVIGFGGRVLEGEKEEGVKYINTPNTLLYDKSRILYGLNFAKTEIRKKDFVILTEGYFDVILVHQAGFENTLALSGTALSAEQMKILKRYTSNIYTAFDMDIAGDAATIKGIGLAQKEDFNIKVISLPKGADPADVVAEDFKKWEGLVESAQDVFDFYFQSAFSKFDNNKPEGKKEIANVLLSKIKEVPNKILQAHWIQLLANKIKVGEEIIWEELKKIIKKEEAKMVFSGTEKRGEGQTEKKEETKEEAKNRKELLEEKILFLVLKNPENLKLLEQDFFSIFSPQMKLTLDFLKQKQGLGKQEKQAGENLGEMEKDDKDIKKILDKAILMIEKESYFNEEQKEIDIEKEIAFCVQELKRFDLKNKLEVLSRKIQEAEGSKEEEEIKNLIEKFNQITKELRDCAIERKA